jgi:hypothetical protein
MRMLYYKLCCYNDRLGNRSSIPGRSSTCYSLHSTVSTPTLGATYSDIKCINGDSFRGSLAEKLTIHPSIVHLHHFAHCY